MLKHGVVIASAALIGTPVIAQQADDRVEVIRLEDAWRQARIDRDLPFLDRFYSENMRIHWLDGSVLSRSEAIARFRDGDSKTDFIRHGPLNVTISGDIAVVTGIDHVGGSISGEYGEMRVRFTDVLEKRDGRWQLLVHQATRTQDRV